MAPVAPLWLRHCNWAGIISFNISGRVHGAEANYGAIYWNNSTI